MTHQAQLNEDLNEAMTLLIDAFKDQCGAPPTPADIAGMMLAKEISLLTLAINNLEERISEASERLTRLTPKAGSH